jgi:Family of unknown function (DUF5678)
MSLYEENRARLPVQELQRYAGKWVAFTMDGRRIVAGADTLLELEERLTAAGEDPQNVAFERIEFEDSLLGGAELF